MRTFLVLICSLALACAAGAAQQANKPAAKKKQAQPALPGKGKQPPVALKRGSNNNQRIATKKATKPEKVRPHDITIPKVLDASSARTAHKPKTQEVLRSKSLDRNSPAGAGKLTEAGEPATKPLRAGKFATKAQQAPPLTAYADPNAAKIKVKRFSLPNKVNPAIATANFQANRRIDGSQNWQGSNYTAFRNYRSQWHDRDWWHRHHSRVILISGGWYYWNSGFWYPAWGYDLGNAYYPYDGPIYGYNDLPPDQVIANVQSALQEQGYYHGEVDGLLGPLTRAAIAGYQRDRGLYPTSAIDQPTLESLGMA